MPLDGVYDLRPREFAALRTGGPSHADQRQRLQDPLLDTAALARQRNHEVTIQQQLQIAVAKVRSDLGKQVRRRVPAGLQREFDRRRIRFVAQAILAPLKPCPVGLADDPVEHKRFSTGNRQHVNQLQRLLRLQGADQRGDRRYRRHTSSRQVLLPQERTTVSQVDQAIVVLGHPTFVARAVRRREHLDHAVQLLNAAVHPGCRHFPTRAIDPQPSFAVIEATDNHVRVAKDAQAHGGEHVPVDCSYGQIRIQLLNRLGRHLGLRTPAVARTEQYRARQVGSLDQIEVDHEQLAHADQRQVLQHFIPQRPGADDQHAGLTQPILIPPRDQPQPRVTVVVIHMQRRIGHNGREKSKKA